MFIIISSSSNSICLYYCDDDDGYYYYHPAEHPGAGVPAQPARGPAEGPRLYNKYYIMISMYLYYTILLYYVYYTICLTICCCFPFVLLRCIC